MKGRFKRLSENGHKWVAAYREAYHQIRSGMIQKDVESEAHKIYEQGGTNFNDSVVFSGVMCKHSKWDLQINRNTTRSRPECEVDNEESDGSTKRSRTTEEGDYCVNSNPDTPTSGGSTIQRPIGRDAAKRKGKGMVSNDFVEELRAMRLTRDSEVELMKKRLEFDQQTKKKMEEI
ncbi:hypothetical protein L1987_43545 [Smallanthus sonchifolius]|uniref:Uncharacterized protein n=1 Tax=Smallanthus sonchifolius TaxID=185202 RepID=A0ACB9GMM0_9ASTR|nr:hypothetical protein L1987_43545 [Smallanthus sonchifolius]